MPRNAISWTKLIAGYVRDGQDRDGLRLYYKMREEGVIPNAYTFVAALKASTTLPHLKALHAHANHTGLTNIFVANTLLDMYAKCGSIDDARHLFENMRHRDVVSWNAIIMGYARMEMGASSALDLYARMQNEGFQPDTHTFVAALKACAGLAEQEEEAMGPLQQGRAIHSQLANRGLESDIFVANILLDMYAKCGNIEDARCIFDKMSRRNVVSWNAMIMGYAQMEMADLALELYGRMQYEGNIPDDRTFVSALKACAALAEGNGADAGILKTSCLEQGRAIHANIVKGGFELNIFVANSLLDMYAKCRSIEDSRQIFNKMSCQNVVSWTTMIMGYAQMEMGDFALQLYADMQNKGLIPDDLTFVAALKACASLAAQEGGKGSDINLLKQCYLEKGRAIHAEVAKRGFEFDIFVASALVDMYAKCWSVKDARQVFEKMRHRSVVSWNAMIAGYAQMEMGDSALELYSRMQKEGFIPDNHTFAAALKACASLAAQEAKGFDVELLKRSYLEQGRAIHSNVAKLGLESDIFVANTLVDMYAKCGSINDAFQVFQRIRHRDTVSWNALIAGYAQMEMGASALELYAWMQNEGFIPDARTFVALLKTCASMAAQEGKGADSQLLKSSHLEQGRAIHTEVTKAGFDSDIFVATTLVDMYGKCGSLEEACHVFEKMKQRNTVSWTVMILTYAHMEMGDLALEVYAGMQQEGFTPDAGTFVAALQACTTMSSLEIGNEIYSHIHRIGLQDNLSIASCLIIMYAKCGCMSDAQQFFDSLPVRNSVTWNALIAGYSDHGDSNSVFSLYKTMQQESVKPDDVTFVSILNVCSHNGLVEEGKMYFQAMSLKYKIFPSDQHYTCMTDLLGRAGQLDETVARMIKMPFKPDIVSWMTILGACRKWNNAETGWNAFECAVMLDENFAAAYVLMTNIYVSSQIWEASARIDEMRTKAWAWKKPGQCRWIDSAGMAHTFWWGVETILNYGELTDLL